MSNRLFPGERNYGDQRHLENELWSTHGVRTEFLTLAEIDARCKLKNGNVLTAQLGENGFEAEVSVVYFRLV